jgi:hypothetical protein
MRDKIYKSMIWHLSRGNTNDDSICGRPLDYVQQFRGVVVMTLFLPEVFCATCLK